MELLSALRRIEKIDSPEGFCPQIPLDTPRTHFLFDHPGLGENLLRRGKLGGLPRKLSTRFGGCWAHRHALCHGAMLKAPTELTLLARMYMQSYPQRVGGKFPSFGGGVTLCLLQLTTLARTGGSCRPCERQMESVFSKNHGNIRQTENRCSSFTCASCNTINHCQCLFPKPLASTTFDGFGIDGPALPVAEGD